MDINDEINKFLGGSGAERSSDKDVLIRALKDAKAASEEVMPLADGMEKVLLQLVIMTKLYEEYSRPPIPFHLPIPAPSWGSFTPLEKRCPYLHNLRIVGAQPAADCTVRSSYCDQMASGLTIGGFTYVDCIYYAIKKEMEAENATS